MLVLPARSRLHPLRSAFHASLRSQHKSTRGLRAWLTSHPPPPPRSQLTAFHDLRSQKQERLTRGGRPKMVQAAHQNSAST